MITLDFETRSMVDLRKCGTTPYASHESTSILCLAYGDHPNRIELWKPGDLDPEDLLYCIGRGTQLFEAHNVFFERNIWYWICHKRFGWPDIPFELWRCSMSACCHLALPRSLEEAGAALDLNVRKDKEGHKIMQRLCKPKKPSKKDPGIWDNDEVKFDRLYEYCIQDVRTEMALSKEVGHLPPDELKLWQLDQRINLRGVCVDQNALESALAVIDQALAESVADLYAITEGVVQAVGQRDRILKWIGMEMGEQPEKLDADTVAQWLSRDDLKPNVRRVLEIRRDVAKASTAKVKSMLDRCDEDGRVRANLVYHGAATGRFAGSGIQIQNYARGIFATDEIDIAHKILRWRKASYLDLTLGSPMDCISNLLRSMVCAAEGNRLLVCDFASIEARVLAWIAGETHLLKLFATGGDTYVTMASKIYKVPEEEVTKPQRHIGKTAILGCGYGMGWKAFIKTCKAMAGVTISRDFSKQVIKTYRETNENIRNLWTAVGTAAIRAIETKQPHRVGRLEFTCDADWLRIKLPNGRHLHYRKPHLVDVVAPWSVGYFGDIYGSEDLKDQLEEWDVDLGERHDGYWTECDCPDDILPKLKSRNLHFELEKKEPKYIKQIQFWGVGLNRKWCRQRTYGAKIVENVVQGIARDFLAEAMFRCEDAGYPIVATIHDEIMCERKIGEGSLEEFEDLMRQIPPWGKGCPIEVEGYESLRFKK